MGVWVVVDCGVVYVEGRVWVMWVRVVMGKWWRSGDVVKV